MFGMWDVRDVGCSGGGMFGMWDVRDVGCSACGMFGMWDVGYGMFAGMWDVDLQNAYIALIFPLFTERNFERKTKKIPLKINEVICCIIQ